MKRWLIIFALIVPALLLLFFSLVPQADTSTPQPIFHFYIVTFITFTAAVVSILLAVSLGSDAKPRHRLASMAFALVGVIFFTHGFATNGALLSHAHPIVTWSAWITLFGCGAVFAVASFDGSLGTPKWLSVRRIVIFTVGLSIFYLSIAIFIPTWLTTIQAQINPSLQNALFLITLALFLFAAYRLWQTWRTTHNRADGALAFVAFWLAQATISLHRFSVWHLSWWLYHIVLLISFLFTAYILLAEYERARRFRLVPYFVATALVVTALLALLASNLFSNFTFNSVTDQLRAQAADKIQNEISAITAILPPNLTPAAANSFYGQHLAALSLNHIVIYDRSGQVAYPLGGPDQPVTEADRLEFVQVLAGQTFAKVYPPDAPPTGYLPGQLTSPLNSQVPAQPVAPADGYDSTPAQPVATPNSSTPVRPTSTPNSQTPDQSPGGGRDYTPRRPASSVGSGTLPQPASPPAQPVYTLVTYAPLRPTADPLAQPIGVLMTIEELPQLAQAIIDARGAGLLIAALTMGLLFSALLLIVRRADRIITQNSSELVTAYSNLRRSEGIRDDLTNMIVHDLRSPLTAISASVDLLGRFTGNDQAEMRTRFIDSARGASQRMMGMIDDMLAVSKMEAGELKLRFETTPLEPLLTEHVGGFASQVEADQKTLAVDCPTDLAADIDRLLVGRVIDNLISNAFKYTDEGDGQIQVSARSENGTVRIDIRDNGEGVPADYKQRIFDKFAQAPSAQASPTRKGAGLGLAFCRLVVEAHHGEISIVDAPGGGSIFKIVLPQKQNHNQ